MVAYELYTYDKMNRYKLIGILPERRKDPKRITRESVLKWGIMLMEGSGDGKNISFKRIIIDDISNKILEVKEPHGMA